MTKTRANKNIKVIIAMSGGVDSSVSAALLKEQGYDVVGVFMRCWNADDFKQGECTAEEDEYWARRAATTLGIPFYSVDLVDEYKKRVVDYFVDEYAAGRTPNPDVMCNNEIKFGVFYDKAVGEMGADYIATGHYARLQRGERLPTALRSTGRSPLPASGAALRSRRFHSAKAEAELKAPARAFAHGVRSHSLADSKQTVRLLRGVDKNKDQTYFLHRVPGERLARAMFPIGEYPKPKVRELARKFNLPNAEKKDSQGLCFIGKVDVGVFLEEYIPQKPGVVVDVSGKELGEHKGVQYYTIGQRKGIGIGGGGVPYYVVDKDVKTNTLVVGTKYEDELFDNYLQIEDVAWINEAPELPAKLQASIRYRQEPQEVELTEQISDNSAEAAAPCLPAGRRAARPSLTAPTRNSQKSVLTLKFKEPQRAVTPGQMAVLYDGDVVLGGGVII